jgi:hypothetical protein
MKVVKTILRTIIYLMGGSILVLLLLAGFTQTQFFRDRLRSYALTQLDSLLAAEVFLGDISGNLVTGFSVNGISLSANGDTLLAAQELGIRYNLFEIAAKTISVHSLILERPVVRLLRRRSGVWNFEEIVRPKPPDSMQTAPFDWAVLVSRLELRDANIKVVDSTDSGTAGMVGTARVAGTAGVVRTARALPAGCLDYSNLSFSGVNLALSFGMRNGEYRTGITRCAFVIDGTPMRVRHFSGEFLVDSTLALVDDMRIVTGRSHLTLSTSMRGMDLLGGMRLEALRACSTVVDLHIVDLDFDELGCCLPAVDFLKGTIRGSVVVAGPFGALHLEKLDLEFGQSRLQLDGRVFNLHDPDNFALDIRLTDWQILPGDLPALMPSFDLPDFSSVGPVRLNGMYEGTPYDFHTQLTAETDAGTIRTGDVALRVGGPDALGYSGTVEMQALDLARLVDDPALASRLNGSITMDGAGITLERVNAAFRATLDSSFFRGLPVTRSEAIIQARPRSIQGSLQLGVANTSLQLTGRLFGRTGSRPQFTAEGSMASLNMADLLHDAAHESDLNMTLRIDGTGTTMATLGGDVRATLTASSYRDYTIEDGELRIVLDQSDSVHRTLEITSPVLDASLRGKFDFTYLQQLLAFEVQSARLAISERYAGFDTLFLTTSIDTMQLRALRKTLMASPQRLDCEYTVQVKDLHLPSLALGERQFNGSGVLTGTLTGNYDRFSSSTRMTVKEFFYGDVDSGMLIEDGEVLIEATGVTPDRSFAATELHLQARARRFDISSTQLDSIEADLRIENQRALYAARAALHPAARSVIQGEARLQGDSILCTVRTLDAAYADFAWREEDSARITITREKIALSGLSLRRNNERIYADGSLGKGRRLQATLTGTGLQLNALRYFLAEEELSAGQQAFDGTLATGISVTGTLERPEMLASIDAQNVAIRAVPFGTLSGTVQYADRALVLHVNGDTPGGPVVDGPELTIEGTIPLGGGADRPDEKREFDLTVHSQGTPLNILDPLLPNFNQITGTLECDLSIRGTVGLPRYAGSIRLADCQFLFEPNNMAYRLEGTFEAAGNRIRVVEATVRNVPADERGGSPGLIRLGGDFMLRDFTPGDFNLSATGQIHVIKEATRKSSLAMYGNLFAETGPRGLRFTGDISHSLLKGQLILRNSSLIFPPTQKIASDESALSVPIIIYDDTSRFGEKETLSAADIYFRAQPGTEGRRGGMELEGATSFLDGLRYDLDIEATGSDTEIRMIFNPTSSEELMATIDGKFSITGDGRRWLGDLRVSRAYYNFYRRFDAGGRILFTGDFMNPEMDITATYRGSRAVRDTVLGDKDERVVVTVKITGTRNEPKLAMNMTIDDVDYGAYQGINKSNDVQSDAIGFIIYGSFPLTTVQRGDVSAEVEKTLRKSLLTGASSLLTGTLSEFLRSQTGFISSVELDFNAKTGRSESADIRLSGQAWSGYWRYGGQILDDPLGNANFSVLYSFGSIFNTPSLRNLMMELESKVERGTFGQANDLRRTNSARMFYRYSF